MIDRLPRASWRLLVATVALAGFALASDALDAPFQELGTLACLATGLLYLTLAVVGDRRPDDRPGRGRAARWPRVLLLVGVAHVLFADGGADQGWPFLQHVVTPVLVLADIAWQPGRAGPLVVAADLGAAPGGVLRLPPGRRARRLRRLDPFAPDYGPTLAGLLARRPLGSAFLVFALERLRQSAYDRDIS